MRRRSVVLIAVGVAGGILALTADIVGAGAPIPELLILGAAIVVAEQFELRPTGRAPLPLSFAVVIVLLRAADSEQFIAIVTLAFAVAVAMRHEPSGIVHRAILYAERLVEAFGAAAVFHVVVDSNVADSEAVILGALAASAITEVAIADLVTFVREHRVAPLHARGADVALITSAMLMAVGYGGIEGEGDLGLWGPLLFSIPLLAAWYSFELLASTSRNLRQTVQALGTAPELAGLVRAGHVQRVADLATSMGAELGLSEIELEQLETASFLHHLGAVCLDAPAPGEQLDSVGVAEAGASVLRGSDALAPAGDIVAAEPLLHRAPNSAVQFGSLSGQVLKVASAFDELTDGSDEHTAWAVEALYTGPLYVYDGRVVGALERVLERRGVLAVRG